MNTKQITKLLTIDNNIELIGSNANKKVKYTTDYDLQENITIDNIKDYSKYLIKFQNIYKKIKQSNNITITDFKSGSFNSLPVRWNYENMMNGFQMIDTKQINFVETLQESGKLNTVKIDLIVFIGDEFVEFSCNYYFSQYKKEVNEILLSLMLDVKKYYHEKKFMKMLKRLLSYNMIENNNVDELINFFNSKIGLFYSLYHYVDVYLFITDKFKYEYDKLTTGITKQQFKQYDKIALSKIKKQLKQNNIKSSKLNNVKEELKNEINKMVIEFINL